MNAPVYRVAVRTRVGARRLPRARPVFDPRLLRPRGSGGVRLLLSSGAHARVARASERVVHGGAGGRGHRVRIAADVPAGRTRARADVYKFVKTLDRSVMIELPEPLSPWYVYWSTTHWHPLVNGFSGFMPARLPEDGRADGHLSRRRGDRAAAPAGRQVHPRARGVLPGEGLHHADAERAAAAGAHPARQVPGLGGLDSAVRAAGAPAAAASI